VIYVKVWKKILYSIRNGIIRKIINIVIGIFATHQLPKIHLINKSLGNFHNKSSNKKDKTKYSRHKNNV
jgi:hypothetical protein